MNQWGFRSRTIPQVYVQDERYTARERMDVHGGRLVLVRVKRGLTQIRRLVENN